MQTTLVILVAWMVSCDGARILALVPLPARSHWIIMEPLFQELASRGHQLTVYSTFPQQQPLANYTDVDFSKQLPPLTNKWSFEMVKKELATPKNALSFINYAHSASCPALNEEPFKILLKSKGEYDVLITELFGSDCFAYFAHILDLPLINIVTTPGSVWAADRTGMPENPSYIPNIFVDFGPHMNLYQRLYNTLIVIYSKWFFYFPVSTETREVAEKALSMRLPPISDVVSKTSLLLVNSHHSIIQSRPFPPNVIEIGGIHIKDSQPLQEDLKNILDNAKSGAIIMSLGSLLRASTIPKPKLMSFMSAFSKIPQTIIFKYEEDELPGAPPNVITRKWLSQRDLLEHKNVVAAIVHGGMASTMEAVYLAKPIIGIPVFSDQRYNIMNIVRSGAGVMLDLDGVTEEKISEALQQVLNDPKYTQNMQRLSLQFRDRPLSALQSAVFWTEYVLRHKGALHLRPASIDLPLYQYLLLDVVVVLLVTVTVLLYGLYRSVLLVLSLATGNSSRQVHKKSN